LAITTFSSREFNQNTCRAKKATRKGPVVITDRGKPAHVLLSMTEYQRITRKRQNIADQLALPEEDIFDFELPRVGGEFPRPADLS
jgi:PHD/YefM family antitoxin component YafN of YafNO toxin-antitoxin module